MDGFRLAGFSVLNGCKMKPRRLEGLCWLYRLGVSLGWFFYAESANHSPSRSGTGIPSQPHCVGILVLQQSISLSQHHLLPKVCVARSWRGALAGDNGLVGPLGRDALHV